MTRIERYRQKIRELEATRSRLMRQGKYVQMHRLDEDIKEVKCLVEEAERYEAKPIKELLTEDQIHEAGIIPMIMECHLAADYLTDCAYNLSDSIKELGFNPVSLIPEMKEIIEKSNAFASILCKKNQTLSDMLTENDTLLAALHKKTQSYIMQRSVVKKPKHKKKDGGEEDRP